MKVNSKQITLGDRIYVRLSFNGSKITEFVVDCVSDMTELIGRVRLFSTKFNGLANLLIRNMTRGWIIERPLMLYSAVFPLENSRKKSTALRSNPSNHGVSVHRLSL